METRKKDYSQCNRNIAEALRNDEDVYCIVSSTEFGLTTAAPSYEWIICYKPEDNLYISEFGGVWRYAEPVDIDWFIRNALGIVRYLEKFKYEPNPDGDWIKEGLPTFYNHMWQYCGKPLEETCDLFAGAPPEWFRAVPVMIPKEGEK